jgi:hypothetical protein
MRYSSLLALLLGTVAGLPAQAQLPTTGAGRSTTAVAPSYTGPGNVVSGAVAWWGVSAYNTAAAGTKAINACNTQVGVDVLCADFLTSASTGQLIITTIGGVACTTNCTIKTFYDQSGANSCSGVPCDATASSPANRAILKAGGIGTCAVGDTTTQPGDGYAIAGTFTLNQPYSFSTVFEPITATDGALIASNGASVQLRINVSGSNGIMLVYAGSLFSPALTVSDGSPHAGQFVWNGASSSASVDGTTDTGDAGAAGFSAPPILLTVATGSLAFVGYFNQGGLWPAVFTGPQIASLNTLQHSNCGF